VVIHEEIDNEKVSGNEGREDKNHDSGKEEACPELDTEFASTLCTEKLLVDLASVVEHKVEDAEHQDPLQCPREELSLAEKGDGDRQIQDILVEQGNHVVLSSHQAIGDV
jgi:hypothetical protein